VSPLFFTRPAIIIGCRTSWTLWSPPPFFLPFTFFDDKLVVLPVYDPAFNSYSPPSNFHPQWRDLFPDCASLPHMSTFHFCPVVGFSFSLALCFPCFPFSAMRGEDGVFFFLSTSLFHFFGWRWPIWNRPFPPHGLFPSANCYIPMPFYFDFFLCSLYVPQI